MDRVIGLDLESWLEDFGSRSANDQTLTRRCRDLIETTAREVARWHGRNQEEKASLSAHLYGAERFIRELDEALHPEDGPFAKSKHIFWRHLNGQAIARLKPIERQNIVDRDQLRQLATEYLTRQYLQNPYLDWVLVDAMTLAEMLGTLEWHLARTQGFAYAMFEGNPLKIFLWKIIATPIGFALSWILPAYPCYLLSERSPNVAIGIAIIYYGWGLFGLMYILWGQIKQLISRTPSENEKMKKLIEEMGKVYSLMDGSVIHVATLRKAFEETSLAGVGWDQQTFYILDRLAQAKQPVWAPVGG
jgi:hypothetical protein